MSFWSNLADNLGINTNAYDDFVDSHKVVITNAEKDYVRNNGVGAYVNHVLGSGDPQLMADAAAEVSAGMTSVGDAPVSASPGSRYVPGAYVSSASGTPTKHFAYVDAPYASQYKMNKATAYQEALANTAHQREVNDLIAAGLNPVLSANGGSGASVFGGEVYSAGGSSGRSVSGFSKSKESDSDYYKNLGKGINTASKILGAVASIFNPGVGAAVTTVGSAIGNMAASYDGD